MLSEPISLTGVDCSKYSTKPRSHELIRRGPLGEAASSSSTDRRARRPRRDLRRRAASIPGWPHQALQIPVRSGSAYLAAITSPCSVSRSDPLTAPGAGPGSHRNSGRPTTDRSAAAVEEPKPDPGPAGGFHQILLGPVQRPPRGQITPSLLESEYPSITSWVSPRACTIDRYSGTRARLPGSPNRAGGPRWSRTAGRCRPVRTEFHPKDPTAQLL